SRCVETRTLSRICESYVCVSALDQVGSAHASPRTPRGAATKFTRPHACGLTLIFSVATMVGSPINGRLRDELLNETLFRSLPHARAVLQAWRRDYNEARPHSKLGWMTPRGYASALLGKAGRDAALRWGSAPRPLATQGTEGLNQPRTL